MLFAVLAYLGGLLTILSPCILPVLPFVFANADRPFRRHGLPLLCGMALTFVLVATLAAVGGEWVAGANQWGRNIALVVMALLGLMLLSQRMAEWLTRPLVALGNRLSNRASAQQGLLGPVALGVATGLLWAPCAGPILGLILAAAAIQGTSVQTSLLLLAYALGAATSLAGALLVGGRLFAWMKRSLGLGEWLKRGLGVLVLAGVGAITLGLDTGLLSRLSLASTSGLEEQLIAQVIPTSGHSSEPSRQPLEFLAVEGQGPSLAGATGWLNSPPLTAEGLRGKVVLLDIWTYSCINCIRTLPYVTAWYDKYKDYGLEVIGVHSPEFAFERDADNVAKAIQRFGIRYPVALDNDYAIWKALGNHYWPAHYFVDAQGQIRAHHFGEGGYRHAEDVIRTLLTEAGHSDLPGGYVNPDGKGEEAATTTVFRSPETYVGYARADNFAGGVLVKDRAESYQAPAHLSVNHWALSGRWKVAAQQASLMSKSGSISYRFRGRDLHLVMAPPAEGETVRFRVTINGKAPGDNHGSDIDAEGWGVITEQRLYQLVRQQGTGDLEVTITFMTPGVSLYAFTFG